MRVIIALVEASMTSKIEKQPSFDSLRTASFSFARGYSEIKLNLPLFENKPLNSCINGLEEEIAFQN